SWSLVPVAKCGFSSVAPCHHSTFSGPPPPRFVGLYAGSVDCDCATPQYNSRLPAIGAVMPSDTILNTKSRRASLPSPTASMSLRSSRSFMSPSWELGSAPCVRRCRYRGVELVTRASVPSNSKRGERDVSQLQQRSRDCRAGDVLPQCTARPDGAFV